MLSKKFIFFSLILLSVSISVCSSPEDQQTPSKNNSIPTRTFPTDNELNEVVKDNPAPPYVLTENERDEFVKLVLSTDYEKSATQDVKDNPAPPHVLTESEMQSHFDILWKYLGDKIKAAHEKRLVEAT